MGFDLPGCIPIPVPSSNSPYAFAAEICKINQADQIELIVCLLPSDLEARYREIKKTVMTAPFRMIPCQCVVRAKLESKQLTSNEGKWKSYVSGILQQIVVKLGGAPWGVRGIAPPKKVMVVGISFSFDRSKVGRQKRMVGFVASIDATFSLYSNQCRATDPGQEIVTNIAQLLTRALNAFKETSESYPEGIVVYREGVGEGMIDAIIEGEINKMQTALEAVTHSNVQDDTTPRSIWMSYILVNKKAPARFVTGSNGNPTPGTVIDHTCVSATEYDFYLISHAANQNSMVGPTYYHVLRDSSNWKPSQLQRFTYQLCHLYYNWLGTTAMPAPLQYAYRLAVLCSTAQIPNDHEVLDKRLHFV
eukprot:TRINITY_DN5138_c0_g1_i3.p1 TRINITY_DN5138_c0_g1~~TRINITY_DN5138_c0_g1_i3.p1  ORF type:complete len:362 (-),score=30.04 TRINITY_DN5138_c0_g1_i3:28-1113(-)